MSPELSTLIAKTTSQLSGHATRYYLERRAIRRFYHDAGKAILEWTSTQNDIANLPETPER